MMLGDVITRIRAQCPGFALVDHVLTSPITYPYPTALLAPVRNQGQPPLVNIPGGYAQDVVTSWEIDKPDSRILTLSAAMSSLSISL